MKDQRVNMLGSVGHMAQSFCASTSHHYCSVKAVTESVSVMCKAVFQYSFIYG